MQHKFLSTIKAYPELFLTPAIIFYWVSTANLFNPVAISLLLVFLLLAVKKVPILAFVVGGIFLMLNLYMILAMLSELNEFPVFNKDAFVLLAVGSIFIGYNIFFSILLILKNIEIDNTKILDTPKAIG